MRWLLALLTALALGLGSVAVAAAEPGDEVPEGSLTIALLGAGGHGADGSDGDDPRAAVYITDHLAPGQTIERAVQVTNDSDTSVTVELYAGPASLVDGAFTVANRGESNELTSWVMFETDRLDLEPGQSDEVTVTIAVPDDAPEGEQYWVIWASTQPQDSDEAEVQVVSRVGVRMYLSVGPGGAPAAGFSVGALEAGRNDDGDATVRAEVTNTGGRAIDVTGELALTGGPGGLSAETVTAQTTTVAPGESEHVVFTVADSAALPAGPWQAEVRLDSGHLTEATDTELTFPDSDEAAVGTVDGIAEWVWIIIALVAAAVVAGAGWAWSKRGNRSAGPSA